MTPGYSASSGPLRPIPRRDRVVRVGAMQLMHDFPLGRRSTSTQSRSPPWRDRRPDRVHRMRARSARRPACGAQCDVGHRFHERSGAGGQRWRASIAERCGSPHGLCYTVAAARRSVTHARHTWIPRTSSIVLVEPSHPGQYRCRGPGHEEHGPERLYLVAPERFPDPEATWRAVSAADVLRRRVVSSAGRGDRRGRFRGRYQRQGASAFPGRCSMRAARACAEIATQAAAARWRCSSGARTTACRTRSSCAAICTSRSPRPTPTAPSTSPWPYRWSPTSCTCCAAALRCRRRRTLPGMRHRRRRRTWSASTCISRRRWCRSAFLTRRRRGSSCRACAACTVACVSTRWS
jgi:hypothetical protein